MIKKKKGLEIVPQMTYMHILFMPISVFWFSNDNKMTKNYQ